MTNSRLLIIDDVAAIGRTISYVAGCIGVATRYTDSPAEFFEIQREWNPTHIAIDLAMPDMDGVQVLSQLASHNCNAQIIITSGFGDRVLSAAKLSAEEHGLNISGILPKPFSTATVRNILSETLLHGISAGTPVGHGSVQPELTADEITRALMNREFQVYYQPKIDCSTLALSGFEALVRWAHPTHGILAPDLFLPMAESQGMLVEITDQVINDAFAWFTGWSVSCRETVMKSGSNSGTLPATLSINLSAKTLNDISFVDKIVTKCRNLELDPARVIFELTETSAMENPTTALDLLTRLRLKNFRLSIDDFGTGFSSMLQLVRLPFSEIKIDKSFVMTANQSSESKVVIESIIGLGHSLGLKATAEGVEDIETLKYLKSVGCDYAQGYYFSRPMPANAVADWMTRWALSIV